MFLIKNSIKGCSCGILDEWGQTLVKKITPLNMQIQICFAIPKKINIGMIRNIIDRLYSLLLPTSFILG